MRRKDPIYLAILDHFISVIFTKSFEAILDTVAVTAPFNGTDTHIPLRIAIYNVNTAAGDFGEVRFVLCRVSLDLVLVGVISIVLSHLAQTGVDRFLHLFPGQVGKFEVIFPGFTDNGRNRAVIVVVTVVLGSLGPAARKHRHHHNGQTNQKQY